MTSSATARTPVIVGIADFADRPLPDRDGAEPLALLEQAARQAVADAGADLLPAVDSVDVINVLTWPYRDLAGDLVERLGISPRRADHSVSGGTTAQRLLHDAANRIAAGETECALICGAEAFKSLASAARQQRRPEGWSEPDPDYQRPTMANVVDAELLRYGFDTPAAVYALYENACRAAWGQSAAEASLETARLWAEMSKVAARTPAAWIQTEHTPEAIATPGAGNRPIAFPYTKLMIANDAVNQAAAVLVTSHERAIAAGIPEQRLVYIGAGAGAAEATSFMERDSYAHSPSIEACLDSALRRAGLGADEFDHIELYSCFPCVPKLARRFLGLDPARVPTVTGGLTFFGGPGNNYMTHAMVGMVRRLRESGRFGLLLGNGDLVTKHFATVLTRAAPGAVYPVDYDAQPEADARRGAVPTRINRYEGPATLETYTVVYQRDGSPAHGLAVCRNPAGERFAARIPGGNKATLERLTGTGGGDWLEPIGASGQARIGADGLIEWTL